MQTNCNLFFYYTKKKRGVNLKRFISFILCFFLLLQLIFIPVFNIPVYGAIVDIDPDVLEDIANNPEKYEPTSIKLTEFLFNAITGGQAYDKFFGTSSEELLSKVKSLFNTQGNVKTDGDNYYLTTNFINEFNKATQNSVHALDGYYLFEPEKSISFQNVFGDVEFKSDEVLSLVKEMITNGGTIWTNFSTGMNSHIVRLLDDFPLYLSDSSSYIYSWDSVNSPSGSSGWVGFGGDHLVFNNMRSEQPSMWGGISRSCYGTKVTFSVFKDCLYMFYGNPFKVFYSFQDAKNYINNGKKRTYAPKLPNVTIKIPVKYINNSVSLPDITYNITTENKTEVEIQNQYDTTIKNYLDNLDNFTDGTDPTPTPTPNGGFTDGTTPTPTPGISDGGDDSGNGKVDLSEITDLLKKILDKLTSFTDSHSKFEKTITDYIEANDGKLDQIIDAIDKLSQGKEDGEDYKCKYDYTELSDYLKKLWNDSDKKFDTMIDLLEENNEYQQKLVDTLDSIKSILIKESIMDSFKDRSKETANKAKEKFPTSVPWDIAIVINAMSTTPEEPKFNLPIKIASLNIDENIEVDLSSGEWEKLAKTCRYMLSLLFVLFMVQLSRRLFFNKGDDD